MPLGRHPLLLKERLPCILLVTVAILPAMAGYAQVSANAQKNKPLGSLSINIISTTNITCGYNNGGFVVSASGGTPPYAYVSYTAQESNGTGIFSTLTAGTYDIIVYDSNNLSATSSVTLTSLSSAPFIASSDPVEPTGCDANDGSLTVHASGGQPPYLFSNDEGLTYQSSNVFNNLGTGDYYIFVKDANGCVTAPWSATGVSYIDYEFYQFLSSSTNSLTAPCAIQFYCYPSAPQCGNNSGSLPINALQGGTPPYTFSIDGINFAPFVNTDGFYGLDPGKYTVYVRDAGGLTARFSVDLLRECFTTATAQGTSCGQNNGSIIITTPSGLPPYTYSIDGINFQTGNTFSNLAAGPYTIIVKDENGATSFADTRVPSGCPSVKATVTNATCGMANGTITAAGFDGNGTYTFSIDGMHFQPANTFPGLASGVYTITVKDGNGFTNATTATVNNDCITLSAVPVTATCGEANGSLTIAAASGVAPYQYSIDGINFQASNDFSNLAQGNYLITVKDVNGLMSSTNATIGNIPGPQINANAQTASCPDNDGSISITQTGGTAPFQYSIDGGNFQNTGVFTSLSSGTKTVTVKDGNGCLATQPVTVPLNDNLSLATGNDPTICEGTGATLPVSSNAVSFAWSPVTGLNDPAILNPVASPMDTTVYLLTVTTGACSRTGSVTVYVNPAPIPDAGADTAICFGRSVQLQGKGGIRFAWSPSTYLDNADIPDPTVDNPSKSITYSLQVTDGNGCQSMKPALIQISVTPPAKVFAGNDTAVVVDQPLPLHAIDVNNSGFTNYQWTPANGLNDAFIQDPTAIISGNITYKVLASTPDGCAGTDSISITVYAFTDIFVPGAFTPNGDGHNDILKPKAIGIKEFRYFKVYNRSGQLVFATSNPDMGWNGALNGRMQNTGAYVWMAMGIDYKGNPVQRKGTVILVR